MYREHTIGVPVYNGERFVGEVIDTMPEYVDRVYTISHLFVSLSLSLMVFMIRKMFMLFTTVFDIQANKNLEFRGYK